MVMDVWRPRGISRRWPFRAFEEGERMLQSDWPFRLVWWRAPRDDMAWAPSIDMIVLGIPRGDIIVAKELARKIDAQLDVVLARKLGAPGETDG